MTVTSELSIGLAVAQWMRSPRGTSAARQRLRELGVPEAEIERRRRAQSDDRSLAGMLRLAVTLVIARGRLEKLETQLDQMMLDASLDETAFMAQLEKVEAARTEASKARMLMLYRINKLLTPDQRAKMAEKAKAMRDQRGDHR